VGWTLTILSDFGVWSDVVGFFNCIVQKIINIVFQQMSEGRKTKIVLLDDRHLDILVKVVSYCVYQILLYSNTQARNRNVQYPKNSIFDKLFTLHFSIIIH